MENTLNNTQAAPDTGNPQNVGGSNGANKSSDFQQTAPVEALNQNQTLEVQRTGEPGSGGLRSVTDNASAVWWIAGSLLLIVLISVLVIRYLKQQDETASPAAAKPVANKPVKTAVKSTAKKPAKKTKSGKPAVKKQKKSVKKRR